MYWVGVVVRLKEVDSSHLPQLPLLHQSSLSACRLFSLLARRFSFCSFGRASLWVRTSTGALFFFLRSLWSSRTSLRFVVYILGFIFRTLWSSRSTFLKNICLLNDFILRTLRSSRTSCTRLYDFLWGWFDWLFQ